MQSPTNPYYEFRSCCTGCTVYLFNTELRTLWAWSNISITKIFEPSFHGFVIEWSSWRFMTWRSSIFDFRSHDWELAITTSGYRISQPNPVGTLPGFNYLLVLVPVYIGKFMSLVLNSISKLLSRPAVCANLKGLEIDIYFYHLFNYPSIQ